MIFFQKEMSHNYSHIKYKVFGFTIAIKNPHAKLYQTIDGISHLLNYIIDINKMPVAIGTLRKKQIKTLESLKFVINICEKYNLVYWIDFGTLIGAVRHKGFIPWDDDIDICMPRADYKKMCKILDKELLNSEFCLEEIGYKQHFQIVITSKIANTYLDIFPIDEFNNYKNTDNINKLINSKIQQARNILIKKWKKKKYSHTDYKNIRNNIEKIQDKVGLNTLDNKQNNLLLFFGSDFEHNHEKKYFEYQQIFPLKKITFEGVDVQVPNNYEKHLTDLYGNWNLLPISFENMNYFLEQEKNAKEKY